ncbi:MAG: hypothetical protein INR72_20230, partial [Williamsia herbipolensis]|nr:hypothetical protein [Williamsia herbipolensis]
DMLDDVDRDAPDGPVGDRVRERVHALGRIDESLALFAERCGMPVTGAGSVGDAPTERARRAAAMLERRLA